MVDDWKLYDEDVAFSDRCKTFIPYFAKFQVISCLFQGILVLSVRLRHGDLDSLIPVFLEDLIYVISGLDAGRSLISLFIPDFFGKVFHRSSQSCVSSASAQTSISCVTRFSSGGSCI